MKIIRKKLILMAVVAVALFGVRTAPVSAAAWYDDGADLRCSLVPFSAGSDIWMVMWRGRNERLTINESVNCAPDSRHVFFSDGGAVSILIPEREGEQFFLSGYYVTRGTNVRKFVVAFDPSNGSAQFAKQKKAEPEKKTVTVTENFGSDK